MRHILIPTANGPVAARLWEQAGSDAPWLHFGHATGMHGGLYASRLAQLADQFCILASDVRGHGRTAAAGNRTPFTDWGTLADDLVTVIDHVAPDAPWLLAGHSLGAVVAALAAVRAPQRAVRLVLVEPAIMPFALARAGGPPVNHMAERAAARRPGFADADAARRAWAGRGVFANWSLADLDAYTADALLPGSPAALACAPAFEAMTFAVWPRDLETALARLAVPFALLAASHGSTVADAEFAALAGHPACRQARRVADADHFLPLSHWPDVAACIALTEPAAMTSAASRRGAARASLLGECPWR